MARRFSRICGECRQKTMVIADVPFDVAIDHDGKKYKVHLNNMTAPKCTNCGAISLDEAATDQIDLAFRKEAGLLTPEAIHQGRILVGFSNQQEFAKCFGVSSSTVSRWENGSQIQQFFHDGMLRAFFELKELRLFLAELHGVDYVCSDTSRITMSISAGELHFVGSSSSSDEDSTNVSQSARGQTDGYEPVASSCR